MDHLREFFAVTMTSIYRVSMEDNGTSAVAVKIDIKSKSHFGLGHKLRGGDMIAICRLGLVAYTPESCAPATPMSRYERKFENVHRAYVGDNTSNIVALFETESEAQRCFETPNLESSDRRFRESTLRVLEKIGSDHPVFYISTR